MKQHISRVVDSCFFQLRRLRQIRRSAGELRSHQASGLVTPPVPEASGKNQGRRAFGERTFSHAALPSGTVCQTIYSV